MKAELTLGLSEQANQNVPDIVLDRLLKTC